MKTILNDLLGSTTLEKKTGRIVSRISVGMYALEDDLQRPFQATSGFNYKAGEYVMTQNGIIISLAKDPGKIKTYSV